MKLLNHSLFLGLVLLASLPASVVHAEDMPQETQEERVRTANQELIQAVEAQDVARVADLLRIFGVDIDVPNNFGRTALSIAQDEVIADGMLGTLSQEINPARCILTLLQAFQHKTAPIKEAARQAREAAQNASRELPGIAKEGNLKKVKALLAIPGITVNQQDEQCNTALMYACRQGNVAMVKILLAAKADIATKTGKWRYDCKNPDYCAMPLVEAAHQGHAAVVGILLAAGASCEDSDSTGASEGDTALIAAARAGHLEVVNTLLEAGAEVDAPNAQEVTALMDAAYHGRTDVVHRLIAVGADVNAQETVQENHTSLTVAAECGHADIVQLLIDAQADLRAESCDGSALTRACENGHIEVVRRLIAADETLVNNADERFDLTPLMAACEGVQPEVVSLLLAANAEVKVTNWGGLTPLMAVCYRCRESIEKPLSPEEAQGEVERRVVIVTQLLAAQSEVNAIDDKQQTALMHACQSGLAPVVERLLQDPAIDIYLTNEAGRTALDEAILMDTYLKYYAGHTALNSAQRSNHEAIIELFNAYEEACNVMIKPAAKRPRPEESDDEL